MNDIIGPKFISIDFIKGCYELLDKYKDSGEKAVGSRIALPDGNHYLELRIHGKLILCDARIDNLRIRVKSNTYRLGTPAAIANMLSKYLEILDDEGFFTKN